MMPVGPTRTVRRRETGVKVRRLRVPRVQHKWGRGNCTYVQRGSLWVVERHCVWKRDATGVSDESEYTDGPQHGSALELLRGSEGAYCIF